MNDSNYNYNGAIRGKVISTDKASSIQVSTKDMLKIKIAALTNDVMKNGIANVEKNVNVSSMIIEVDTSKQNVVMPEQTIEVGNQEQIIPDILQAPVNNTEVPNFDIPSQEPIQVTDNIQYVPPVNSQEQIIPDILQAPVNNTEVSNFDIPSQEPIQVTDNIQYIPPVENSVEQNNGNTFIPDFGNENSGINMDNSGIGRVM